MTSDICSRRNFLRTVPVGALGLASGAPGSAAAGSTPPVGKAGFGKAKRVICLFLSGGPTQFETFDPRPEGAGAGKCAVGTIQTSLPGTQFCEWLPNFAKLAHLSTIVRSMHTVDPNHSTGRYYTHTGYRNSPLFTHPSIGSIVGKELHREKATLPDYVMVGPVPGAGITMYHSYGAGFLGSKYSPVVMKDPAGGLPALHPLDGEAALNRRLQLMTELARGAPAGHQSEIVHSERTTFQQTLDMMSSKDSKVFDLSNEPAKTREIYQAKLSPLAGAAAGGTPSTKGSNSFGDACLMARRLAEAGVSYVEVGFGSWDTHSSLIGVPKVLTGILDVALAALVNDLKDRGLLDSTLIVVTGEHGRTAHQENNSLTNGRAHEGKGWSTVLIGGGVRGGTVGKAETVGEKQTRQEIKDRPVTIQDLHATVYHALGIDYSQKHTSPNGFPVKYVDHS